MADPDPVRSPETADFLSTILYLTNPIFLNRLEAEARYRGAGVGSTLRSSHRRQDMNHYCLECDWNASTEDGYTGAQLSQRTIDHFVETGHSVESDDQSNRGTPGGPDPGSRMPRL